MPNIVRFGVFELDLETADLRGNGPGLRLPEQQFQILKILIERDRGLVSREEIRKRLWPADTVVEFDGSINAAILKLRAAMRAESGEDGSIETVARRGYRLLVPVHKGAHRGEATASRSLVPESPVEDPPSTRAEGGLELQSILPEETGGLVPVVSRSRFRPRFWAALTSMLFVGGVLTGTWTTLIPRLARYFNNRGVDLQHHGQLNRAIANYHRAIWLDAGYAAAHYNLADAYEEIPDYGRALAEYQRAIDADLKFYPAYNNLSRLYILRFRDYGTAIRLLDHALALKPEETSVQYSLHKNYGWANAELRNFSLAEHELRIAVGLDAERGSAHCLLAKILDTQGNTSGARAEWEACLAYSTGADVEPEWHVEAQEQLYKQVAK